MSVSSEIHEGRGPLPRPCAHCGGKINTRNYYTLVIYQKPPTSHDWLIHLCRVECLEAWAKRWREARLAS